MKKDSPLVIKKCTSDINGHYVLLDLLLENKIFTLVNLYAPNHDDPDFFIEVIRKHSVHNNCNVIICGNFNFVINKNIDCTNEEHKNNEGVKCIFEQFMQELMVIDVWHCQYPESKCYTWIKKNLKFTASRLEYFFINYGLTTGAFARIEPAIVTDHSTILLDIQIDNVVRGKGLWKMNSMHLAEHEYLDQINNTIDEAIFNFHKETPDKKWELIKDEVIKTSKEYSK